MAPSPSLSGHLSSYTYLLVYRVPGYGLSDDEQAKQLSKSELRELMAMLGDLLLVTASTRAAAGTWHRETTTSIGLLLRKQPCCGLR